jgi:hypothetical protein
MLGARVGDLVCIRGTTRDLTHNPVFIHKCRELTYFNNDTAGFATNDTVFIVLDVDGDYGHTICVCDGTLKGWTDAYDWKKL